MKTEGFLLLVFTLYYLWDWKLEIQFKKSKTAAFFFKARHA